HEYRQFLSAKTQRQILSAYCVANDFAHAPEDLVPEPMRSRTCPALSDCMLNPLAGRTRATPSTMTP
ncbi:MAG: hypothetical protein Q8K27_01950, partial [Betaproteobacteria bacterium]|nr:hypothetical protein [Betaproteobacteria bacterium]